MKKYTSESQFPFDVSSCMEMIGKMMGEHIEGCDCAEMMSKVTGQEGLPEEWLKVMSQMMEIHCRPQEEAEKSSQEE